MLAAITVALLSIALLTVVLDYVLVTRSDSPRVYDHDKATVHRND